ncbi:heat shock factor protein 1-like, partial [Corapipo altera]|uniref:heat shock factor protein 1-like n=1 Tax=Corapipo altera TaxID=415028 RepID=UPI000FD63E90
IQGSLGTDSLLPPFLPARNELNDHLDTIDSNLDNLQTMLSTHGFSMDSALLDLFSPSMTVTDMNLPDLDSSLASIQDLLSAQEQQKPTETEAGTADTGTKNWDWGGGRESLIPKTGIGEGQRLPDPKNRDWGGAETP